MKNIYLIGFMGAGKTSVGRTLQKKTGLKLVDTDEIIVTRIGRSIPEIFDKRGEEYFRDLEHELLCEIAESGDCIVSCGGGAAIFERNVTVMKKSGTVVYLSVTPETVYARVGHDKNRPVLEGHRSVSGIRELMSKRIPYYAAAADIEIPTDELDRDEIAERIMIKCEEIHSIGRIDLKTHI